MRKSVLYPTLALVLGAAAAALRMWQRTSGYDESGLPVPFALPSIVLAVFLLLCAGAILYAALRRPKALEEQKNALPQGDLPALLLAAAGVLVLIAGMLSLLDFFRSYLAFSQVLYATQREQREALRVFLSNSLLTGVLALACVPTSVALLVRARKAKQGAAEFRTFPVMMPSILGWLWLIDVYRGHTSNPILWDYVLLLLAVVALLAAAYERAGFALGVGKPRRSVFSSLAALILSVAALPDCGGMSNALILLALAVLAWVDLSALLACFEYRPKRLATESDESTAQSSQQEDVSHE